MRKNYLIILICLVGIFNCKAQLTRIAQFCPRGINNYCGGEARDVWGYYDKLTGKEYAILGGYMVDISDPYAPQFVSELAAATFDIKSFENYIYTCSSGGGGAAINVNDINNPIYSYGHSFEHNIAISDNGLLFSARNGKLYDLNENPSIPRLIKSDLKFSHDGFFKNNKLYTFGSFDFTGESECTIYDVSDTNDIKIISQVIDPNIRLGHSGYVTEDEKYLYICDEFAKNHAPDITVWDISDLSDPEKVFEITDTINVAHNLFIKDNYAYVSFYTAGLRIYDITNGDHPILVEEYDTYDVDTVISGFIGAFGVYPYTNSGKILVSDMDSGLLIFDFKPPVVGEEEVNVESNFSFSVSPNPVVNGVINLSIDNTLKNEGFEIQLIDITGKVIEHISIRSSDKHISKQLSLVEFSKGVYFLKVATETGNRIEKVVVQ